MKKNVGGTIAVLLLTLFFLIGAGFAVFRFFAADVIGSFGGYSLYLVAVLAGVAAFFSPCSFPLLPTYLGLFGNDEEDASALRHGLLGAAGILLFNVLLGGVIGVLGAGVAQSFSISAADPSPVTRIIRIGIGALLLFLGVVQFTESPLLDRVFHRVGSLAPGKDGESSEASAFFYGFGYTLAGIGCAGPILSALTVFAITAGGFSSAFLAFTLYSVTMASLLIGLTVLLHVTGRGAVEQITEKTPLVKKGAAIFLVLVGGFLIYTSYNIGLFKHVFFPG